MRKKLSFVFSYSAEEDIISLYDFLRSQKEEQSFLLVYERIRKSIFLLREFPDLGEYNDFMEARVLLVPNTKYSIIFRKKDGVLEILRIYHTSRKWSGEGIS